MVGPNYNSSAVLGTSFLPLPAIKISINSSVRSLTYTVASGGITSGSGSGSHLNGESGCVVIREFTTETVYIRTA